MIPVFVINLSEEIHRWTVTSAHLAEHGLDCRRVIGFNGVALGIRPTSPHDIKPDGSMEYQHPTQLAVCLGHLQALRFGLETNEPWFAVLEDDAAAVQKPNLDGLAAEAESVGVDLVQLEYCCDESLPKRKLTERLSECRYPQCCAAMLWSRKAAMFAVSNLRPLCSPIDIMLIRTVYPFVNHAIATPAVFRQRSAAEWMSHCANKT